MNRLPPGQIETKRFPVVGERGPSSDLAAAPETWTLHVEGLASDPMTFDLATLSSIATASITFDIHCVTSWTRFDSTFTGVPLRQLVPSTALRPESRFVSFTSYSERDHHTSLPMDVAMEHSWLVHSFEGKPLGLEHGGPVRVITPGRYFYKSLKWVRSIEFLEADRLGWWETNSSYHNNAGPETGKERFTTGSLAPEQLQRFLTAPRYDKYRGRVMLGLDLREWRPATNELQRLHLKNCDLRGIDLSRADLGGANLSLSDLRGANLSGARLTGCDLEGANFVGADLSGADISDSALSATRFSDGVTGAIVDGLKADKVWGLVEEQEEYLRAIGIAVDRSSG